MSKKQQNEKEVDYLGYVQTAIKSIPKGGLTGIAAAAGISTRTIQMMRRDGRKRSYETILNLYKVLKASERKKEDAANKEAVKELAK